MLTVVLGTLRRRSVSSSAASTLVRNSWEVRSLAREILTRTQQCGLERVPDLLLLGLPNSVGKRFALPNHWFSGKISLKRHKSTRIITPASMIELLKEAESSE